MNIITGLLITLSKCYNIILLTFAKVPFYPNVSFICIHIRWRWRSLYTDITVYIHIGTLFAKLTKTVLSLHMHRYLSAINRNSHGKSWLFSNYADKRIYVDMDIHRGYAWNNNYREIEYNRWWFPISSIFEILYICFQIRYKHKEQGQKNVDGGWLWNIMSTESHLPICQFFIGITTHSMAFIQKRYYTFKIFLYLYSIFLLIFVFKLSIYNTVGFKQSNTSRPLMVLRIMHNVIQYCFEVIKDTWK